jgi:hypothetical protein
VEGAAVCPFWQLVSSQNKKTVTTLRIMSDSIIHCFQLKLRILKIAMHYVDLDVFIPT